MTRPMRPILFCWLLACFSATVLAVDAKSESKWEEVTSTSGKIKNTTSHSGGNNNNNKNNKNSKNGANNSNYRVKPVYFDFELTGPAMRIKYEAKETGERPDLRIELEKEITKSNGDKDWQRIGLVGRPRGEGAGGNAFTSGPGRYRFELTGQNTEYKITVEQPAKK